MRKQGAFLTRKAMAKKKRTAKHTPKTPLPWESSSQIDFMNRMAHSDESNPFHLLGPHYFPTHSALVIHAYLPRAFKAWIVPDANPEQKIPFVKVHPAGFYRCVAAGASPQMTYQILSEDEAGCMEMRRDAYAFYAEISDYELYLVGETSHFRSYELFGSRPATFQGVSGVHFAVWAPNAASVSVIGDFNRWRIGEFTMSRIHHSGIWRLFIPGLKEGDIYKYAVKSGASGHLLEKTDPYAFQTEIRPKTAPVVCSLRHYQWNDAEWIAKREEHNGFGKPISIYEVHLGSWKRQGHDGKDFLNYRDLAHQLVEYMTYMGYTHIELLPIMEHPLDESWGYQTVNYYAPTSRFGTPEDFMYFVDHCHQNHIGVILDWVPSHFPRDGHGLNYFDGTQIYADANWKRGEHKEWGTLVFDYGRREVKNFLISNALFWLDKYHIDGLRVDAVASMLYLDYSRPAGEWEPNIYGGRENLEAIAFIKEFNEVVHKRYPGVLTIAEESTSWPAVSRPTYVGGLGFSMKWNMGWMHDTLLYCSKDPIHRRHHQEMLTFSLLYAFYENFVSPISHDEVVHGKRSLIEKMPGDDWQKFANLRLFLGFMYGQPGKKLLFMGQDFAQRSEWSATHSLDWHLMQYEPHQKIHQFVKDLNHIYRTYPAFYEVDFDHQGFEWIDFTDESASLISFIRWSRDFKDLLLFVCNMTPVPRINYRVGVPKTGFYREILNSDALEYGGGGIGNLGGKRSENIAWHHRPHSINLNAPPLAINVFRLEP